MSIPGHVNWVTQADTKLAFFGLSQAQPDMRFSGSYQSEARSVVGFIFHTRVHPKPEKKLKTQKEPKKPETQKNLKGT
jgi:hypothetical protein